MENQPHISLEQAIELALSKAITLSAENVSYWASPGRILAEDVYADVNMPPFDKSAMDGYACKAEDLGKWLDIAEVIAAGSPPSCCIQSGQCSKIMTGAEVPKGADTVFIIEQSELNEKNQVRFTGKGQSKNICYTGEDVKKGDLVLKSGTHLKAQHIAILSAVGCTEPLVYRTPRVGIISTGSELVEPQFLPAGSQIRNSNGHQMYIQAKACQCEVNYYGIVADDESDTQQMMLQSTQENDVTLISGGVSVGDFDYVPHIIRKLGFDIILSKIAVKPGKHTTFAFKENKYIIGLPGNPVSSFIQFELFVRPFLQKLMNYHAPDVTIPLPLASGYQRRKADRQEFIPIKLNSQSEVEPIPYHGSAHIHAYDEAWGFMAIPQGITAFEKGETVIVRPLL